MARLVDYSTGPPSAADIRAAGFAGAVRYLKKKGESIVTTLTADEVADFRARGLQLALCYEDPEPDFMFGGRDVGIDRARWALEQAHELGIANPTCIYLCADKHATADEVARVMDCLDGARTILGAATGIYGFPEVIHAAIEGKHAEFFWQCGRRDALRPGVHIYQRNNPEAGEGPQTKIGGFVCDINDVLIADFGHESAGAFRRRTNMALVVDHREGDAIFVIDGGVKIQLTDIAEVQSTLEALGQPRAAVWSTTTLNRIRNAT